MSESDEAPTQWFAGFLGWVVPGLGHIYLGHRQLGALAMIGVLGLFVGGVFIGGIDTVDRREDRLWFFVQTGAGPLAFGADWANQEFIRSGSAASLVDTPPSSIRDRANPKVSLLKGIGPPSEVGTLYCALAGLMNVVVVLDVLARPRVGSAP